MMHNVGIFAWVTALAAAVAWIGVFMYAAWITEKLDARSSQTANAQSISEREIADVRIHTLARDTLNQRTQLEGLAHFDVISVADTIEGIGKIAGVKLTIGSATSESTKPKKGATGGAQLHAVSFVVEASGTFSALMYAAALLETLPVPSSVESLEFEHVPLSAVSESAASSGWRLIARIRVVTASDISS
jgi:hypothetical protein